MDSLRPSQPLEGLGPHQRLAPAGPIVLDRADRRILFELDCDSRQSLSQLARKVRLGRDLVSYRIERLADSGVIKRCSLMINPYKLGLTVYKTYLRLETNKTRVSELVAHLDRHPSTYWLAECHGEWDLVFSVLARTPKEFYDHQNSILSDFRDIIAGFNVYTLINYWWFPRKYLVGPAWKEERLRRAQQLAPSVRALPASSSEGMHMLSGWGFHSPEFTFGSTPDEYCLDSLEFQMVNLLSKNARQSMAEVAEKLGTTVSVVKYRLEKLEKLGAIAGYRVDIDRAALGMTLFKVMVHQRDYDVKKEGEFREFCRDHPHISCYVQQIGQHKIEFEVEVENYTQFHAVIDEVREKYSKFVRTMDYMVIRRDHHHRTPCSVFLGTGRGEPELAQAG